MILEFRDDFHSMQFRRYDEQTTTTDEPAEADHHDSSLEASKPSETRLELADIMPINPKKYDKNKPPKNKNQPTIVDFHVTVLSLDSINEESMVSCVVRRRGGGLLGSHECDDHNFLQ